MATRCASLGHRDLAARPAAGLLDGLTRSWVVRPNQLEPLEDVLGARCRPQGQELVIRIGEDSTAADRHEARVAIPGEDQGASVRIQSYSLRLTSTDAEGQNHVVAWLHTALLGAPTLTGSLLALVFWWESLTPTLIPRSWAVQAVISGICLGIGYGIGTLVGRCSDQVLVRWRPSPTRVTRRRSRILLGLVWLVSAFAGAALWSGWQNEQHALMGIAPVGWSDAVLMVALSIISGVLFVVVGRPPEDWSDADTDRLEQFLHNHDAGHMRDSAHG
jgi:hypothetical protein